MDIGRDRAAAVSACMNTAGQLGGSLSPLALALIVEQFSDWAIPLYLTGAFYLLGALAWLLVDPTKPLTGESEPVAAEG